jgi:hypothetical protein
VQTQVERRVIENEHLHVVSVGVLDYEYYIVSAEADDLRSKPSDEHSRLSHISPLIFRQTSQPLFTPQLIPQPTPS